MFQWQCHDYLSAAVFPALNDQAALVGEGVTIGRWQAKASALIFLGGPSGYKIQDVLKILPVDARPIVRYDNFHIFILDNARF
jgi:hypothetical protein